MAKLSAQNVHWRAQLANWTVWSANKCQKMERSNLHRSPWLQTQRQNYLGNTLRRRGVPPSGSGPTLPKLQALIHKSIRAVTSVTECLKSIQWAIIPNKSSFNIQQNAFLHIDPDESVVMDTCTHTAAPECTLGNPSGAGSIMCKSEARLGLGYKSYSHEILMDQQLPAIGMQTFS